jgi:hypothetical protein
MPHPYTTTISGMVAALRQLRSNFPPVVNADTLKKWSIGSNNEAPIIVVLRFLRLIDDEGKKIAENAKAFVEHDDAAFAVKFESIVKAAYTDLFDTWGDGAWSLERNRLIGFFRNADATSARVGQEQAATFLALAGLGGRGPAPTVPVQVSPKTTRSARVRSAKQQGTPAPPDTSAVGKESLGPVVTLRVEINLPVSDKQSVYDSIFKSIKAHLLNA